MKILMHFPARKKSKLRFSNGKIKFPKVHRGNRLRKSMRAL